MRRVGSRVRQRSDEARTMCILARSKEERSKRTQDIYLPNMTQRTKPKGRKGNNSPELGGPFYTAPSDATAPATWGRRKPHKPHPATRTPVAWGKQM